MNLWSWPFLTTGTRGRLGPRRPARPTNLRHYLTFYAASSSRVGHVPRGGQRRARARAGPAAAGRARPRREADAPRGVPVGSRAMAHAPSDRTRIHRHPERGDHDPATIRAVLDERPAVHRLLGRRGRCTAGDSPRSRRASTTRCTCTAPAAPGHGRRSPAAPRSASWPRSSTSSCSLARRPAHSMNYRSVVLFGRGREVTDRASCTAAAKAITRHVLPGRELDAAEPDDEDWRQTLILAMTIDEASAKVRTGPPEGRRRGPRARRMGRHASPADGRRAADPVARPPSIDRRSHLHPRRPERSSHGHEQPGAHAAHPRPSTPRARRVRPGAGQRDRRRGDLLPPLVGRRRRRAARDPHDPHPPRRRALRARLCRLEHAPRDQAGPAHRDRDHDRRRHPVRALDVRALDELPHGDRVRHRRGGHRPPRARPRLRRDHGPRRARPQRRRAPADRRPS